MKTHAKPYYLISTLLALHLLLIAPLSVAAYTLNYTPATTSNTASISGKFPLSKIGQVNIPRGRASIQGNSIEITTIPEWQFDRVPVLNGSILNVHATTSGTRGTAIATVYFQSGPWLKYLDERKTLDNIETTSQSYIGHITTIDDQNIELEDSSNQSHKLALTDIKSIQSPRAYMMTIPITSSTTLPTDQAFTADATNITLAPSGRLFVLSTLKHDLAKQEDHDLSTAQFIGIGTLLSAVQVAQMAPYLIVPIRNRHWWTASKQQLMNTLSQPGTPPGSVLPPAPNIAVPVAGSFY